MCLHTAIARTCRTHYNKILAKFKQRRSVFADLELLPESGPPCIAYVWVHSEMLSYYGDCVRMRLHEHIIKMVAVSFPDETRKAMVAIDEKAIRADGQSFLPELLNLLKQQLKLSESDATSELELFVDIFKQLCPVFQSFIPMY